MKNIYRLKPMEAIIFENGKKDKLILIKDKTEVIVITNETELLSPVNYKKEYSGLVIFVNSDGIELENSKGIIFWEYIKEICII
jgi:hypothetical protein